VLTALIALGQNKARVIAEGVETEERIAFLRENNCDEMQGYHCKIAPNNPQSILRLSSLGYYGNPCFSLGSWLEAKRCPRESTIRQRLQRAA
jgi:hypothetical protein